MNGRKGNRGEVVFDSNSRALCRNHFSLNRTSKRSLPLASRTRIRQWKGMQKTFLSFSEFSSEDRADPWVVETYFLLTAEILQKRAGKHFHNKWLQAYSVHLCFYVYIFSAARLEALSKCSQEGTPRSGQRKESLWNAANFKIRKLRTGNSSAGRNRADSNPTSKGEGKNIGNTPSPPGKGKPRKGSTRQWRLCFECF